MEKGIQNHFQDMLDAIVEIHDLVVGMDFTDYFAEEETQTGVFRNLETIGKTARALSSKTRQQYARIDWERLASIPQSLVKESTGIDHEAVWECVSRDILPIEEAIRKLIEPSPPSGKSIQKRVSSNSSDKSIKNRH